MTPLKKIRTLIFLILITLLLPGYDVPSDPQVVKIIQQLAKFRTQYRQQKVHLQTDKDVYMASENIWIKSYLIEATYFLADSVSKEVFVDLIDFNNQPVRTIIIRNKNGFGQGYITINDSLIEGHYQLRAYTNWMRNFDSEYFFTKNIVIKNPNFENIVTTNKLKEIKQINRKKERLIDNTNFTFFPEGGNMINGIEGTIAFKAENGVGTGLAMKGSVFEDKVKIADFKSIHNGMGFFKIKPLAGKKYKCQVIFSEKNKKIYELPVPLPTGVSLSVNPFIKDKFELIITSNRAISQNISENEIKIVAQSRNTILYFSKGELKGNPLKVNIPKSLFPAGIVQITLFDNRNEPLCERLVFINPETETKNNVLNVTETKRSDSTLLTLTLAKPDSNVVSANLSVSIKEKLESENNSGHSSILTNLLLTSDLKGKIENPGYYFSGTPEAEKNIDLVMLTHGWRRYVWKNLLAGKFPEIICEPSLGVTIGGKITKDFFGIPVPEAQVRLTIKSSYNDVFETKANKKGWFQFPNLDYEDTIDVLIEAFKPSGGKGVQIILGDTLLPDIVTPTSPFLINTDFPKEKLKYNNQQKRIEFNKNYKRREPDNQNMKIHQTPNDVIYVGDDVVNYSNILDYMQGKIPGVNITGNRVIIRGINTFYGSTDPLFLLDGIPIDANSVSMINPMDIAIIEVLKGPEASIYGSRGANGVIAFYSRRGHFMKRGQIEFGMLGYQKVKEFYNPPYESWKYKPQDYKVPRTIYWKPELKVNSSGTATIKFKNIYGNIPYSFTIEGLTNTGEIIYMEK
jgi:TonB-dependent SusC/RagA subfamily outer membrane receptor